MLLPINETHRWFLSCCRPAAGSALTLPTAADIEWLRQTRHETRVAEGGGGMCHVVTDLASRRFLTWSRTSVCFLSEEREPISGAHYVNVLPDGTIVDATADQFGERQDIAIVRPWDTRYLRYRMEWYSDFNPSNDASCAAAAEALGISWTGESDEEVAVSLERSRGYGWWLNDVIDYAAYLDRTIGYAEAAGDAMCGAWARRRLAGLAEHASARFPAPMMS